MCYSIGFSRHGLSSLIGAICLSMVNSASAANAAIHVELNKAEQVDAACKTFLLIENRTAEDYRKIKLDLVVFNTDKIIEKRFALNVAPIAANKTLVKNFNIADIACDDISQILLNDVLDCEQNLEPCINVIDVSTKSSIRFFK